ncbi:MAG TPA: class I SAM-dependent methyltransferase, partial [Bdellovibrionota bacterium]|nr:class I SAM-dependent methyltransferase [Bdellovibrionota bacterium]
MEFPPCPLCEETARVELHASRERGGGMAARRFLLCGRCDLVYVHPDDFITSEAERAHYGTHENSPDDPKYAEFLNRALIPLAERLAPGSKGLDFGSGPGPAVATLLGARGHTVVNYDPFFAPDAQALWGKYDFITATEVIEHFRRPRDEFVLLDQLLKPRGFLAAMTEVRSPAEDMRT